MGFLILLIAEIIILYLLSRNIISKFYKFIKNQTLFAILFLPGTFVHEISHFLTALFLLVPVGEPEFLPKKMEDGIKLGSVPIGKTDPIRRSLIGIAPIIFGLIIIFASVFYLYPKYILVLIYISFEIGNTMFSSKKDLEGVFPVVITIIILYIIFYILGVRINYVPNFEIFKTADIFLLVPIGVDLLLSI